MSVDLSARPRDVGKAVRVAANAVYTNGNPIPITNASGEHIAYIVPVPKVPTAKELWLEPGEV